MNIVLWVVQVALALAFAMHSYTLGVQHEQVKMQRGMEYVGAIPAGLRTIIAVFELLGGVGLILPAATGILPWLTPVAALGLVALMVLAASFHVTRREVPNIILNLVLLAAAAFVAYGRWNLLA